MTALFREKAPVIMRDLMRDFDLTAEDAAAVVGNLGHESGGFRFLQEKKPLVPGSRGGWGWAQWTASRRRAFEAWVAARGLDPASDEANYGYLVEELRGSERRAIPAVKAAVGLRAKVEAFERAFERAGIKHYESRMKYAQAALAAYDGREAPKTAPKPKPRPERRQWGEAALQEPEVRAIQERLRELGYFMVGKVDGDWGGATRGAITAFQSANGLEDDGRWGAKTREALWSATAVRRPISEARANTTADDLRSQGSATVIKADRINWAQWGQVAMAFLECIVIAYQTYQANPLPFGGGALLAMAGTPAWLIPIAQFGFAFYTRAKANGVIMARLNAERSGLHNGEPDPAPSPPLEHAPEPLQGLSAVLGGLLSAGEARAAAGYPRMPRPPRR